jgi:hypothetical protein
VVNEVDDVTECVPPGFTYVCTSSERMSGAALAVLDSSENPPPGPGALAHTAGPGPTRCLRGVCGISRLSFSISILPSSVSIMS